MIKLCKQAIFDSFAEEIAQVPDWWPPDEVLHFLLITFNIYEQDIIPAMISRGWHFCEQCQLWGRNICEECNQ